MHRFVSCLCRRTVFRGRAPVGLVVVSGLTTSTVLTLVLAPTLYSLLDDLALWVRGVLRASYEPAVE